MNRSPFPGLSLVYLGCNTPPTRTGWWFGTWLLFSHILGMSSSQLTNSYCSEGWRKTTNQLIISSDSLWGQGKSRQEDCEVHWKGGTEELEPCWNVGTGKIMENLRLWTLGIYGSCFDDHPTNRHVDWFRQQKVEFLNLHMDDFHHALMWRCHWDDSYGEEPPNNQKLFWLMKTCNYRL